MNKTIEKILKKIEEKRNKYQELADSSNFDGWNKEDIYYSAKAEMCEELKEIVQEVAKEYKNGWIPCSERLPEEYDSIFAKLKGTDKWNDAMFEKTSDVVNVTVADVYGNRITTIAHTVDGKWHCDLLRINKSYQIIAWQPLPECWKGNNN